MEWFQRAVDFFQVTLSLAWVGSILAIFGILISYMFYIYSRQRGLLRYGQSGERLLGLTAAGLPEGVTVLYRGDDIPRLTRTIFWLWNDGERTFRRSDLVANDHLRLEIIGVGGILAASVLKQARDVCDFDLVLDPSDPTKVLISFEFLDKKDGAVLEILHSSDQHFMKIRGTIIGLPSGPCPVRNPSGTFIDQIFSSMVRVFSRFRWLPGVMTIGLGIGIAAPGFFKTTGLRWTLEDAWSPDQKAALFAILVASFIYILLGIFLLYKSRRAYPKALRIDVGDGYRSG
jgi:hypothetical protein